MHWQALLALLVVDQARVVLPESLVAPVCVGCRVDAAALREGYSEEAWQRMTAGAVVIGEVVEEQGSGGTLRSAEAAAIIPHSAPNVWRVLTDFESRSRYVPGAKEIRIVRSEGNRLWLAEHIRVMMVNVRYQVMVTLEPEHGLVSWMLDRSVPHDIADTRGLWQLAPLAEGKHTLLKYRNSLDSGKPLPGFVEDFLTRRSLPQLIEGMREETERRFGSP